MNRQNVYMVILIVVFFASLFVFLQASLGNPYLWYNYYGDNATHYNLPPYCYVNYAVYANTCQKIAPIPQYGSSDYLTPVFWSRLQHSYWDWYTALDKWKLVW